MMCFFSVVSGLSERKVHPVSIVWVMFTLRVNFLEGRPAVGDGVDLEEPRLSLLISPAALVDLMSPAVPTDRFSGRRLCPSQLGSPHRGEVATLVAAPATSHRLLTVSVARLVVEPHRLAFSRSHSSSGMDSLSVALSHTPARRWRPHSLEITFKAS